jgi:tRNA G18 (ribose-2'-O)-methylase SpoU
MIAYIKFILKSSNQHGVHSPFVYDLITQGLYKKGNKTTVLNNYAELKKLSTKEQKVLSNIINYYKINKIYFDFKSLENNLNNEFKLLYIKELNQSTFLKNDSNYFVVINKIHKNKNVGSIWRKLIRNKKATVTIDLFYFGLVFFRKEQVKEHFIIRV